MFLVCKNTDKIVPMGLFLEERNAIDYKEKTEKNLKELLSPIGDSGELEIYNIASDVENVIIRK